MSLLPPLVSESIVAIGSVDDAGNFTALATGFLIGYKNGNVTEDGRPYYALHLVTNRHVFVGKEKVWLRFNRAVETHRFELSLKDLDGVLWTAHENELVDVAVVAMPVQALVDAGIVYKFIEDDDILESQKMLEMGVRTGDEVFVLGFPMTLAGTERNYPIVRAGMIARLDNEILEKEHHFLIDSAIYGGNSGGPVLLKPSLFSASGTATIAKTHLLGVVRAVRFSTEILYGLRNGGYEPRMILNDHANLAEVVPMNYVREAVEYLKQRVGARTANSSDTPPDTNDKSVTPAAAR